MAKKKSKTDTIVQMLIRPQGATRAQILKAAGWKALSVQAVARSRKLKLTWTKERPFVYHGAMKASKAKRKPAEAATA